MNANNMGHLRDVHTISWSTLEALSVAKGSELFVVNVTAKADGYLSQMITLNSAYTPKEAYKNGKLEKVDVKLYTGDTQEIYVNELLQNVPNPFTEATEIMFNIAEAGTASITVYDPTGKVLYKTEKEYKKGQNSEIVRKSDVQSTSGILYYRLDFGDYSATRKMTFID